MSTFLSIESIKIRNETDWADDMNLRNRLQEVQNPAKILIEL